MTLFSSPRSNHLSRWWQWIAFVVVVVGNTRASAQTYASAFTYADVGNVGVAGNATSPDCCGFDVHAAGADIWGTADSFGFVYTPLVGNGEVFLRASSLQNTNPFAKVGLMLRDSLDPSSADVIVDLRPTGDIEFMSRANAGAETTFLAGGHLDGWGYLYLIRDGSTVTAYYTTSGGQNARIGSTTITMGQRLLLGIAVTSHDASTLTDATTDVPQIFAFSPFPDSRWNDLDVGKVGQVGGATFANGVLTVRGAGADIWDTSDSFHTIGRGVLGDAQIIARVTGVQNTNPFAKAGIDMRLGRGPSPTDSHVVLDVRPTGDVEFMTRSQFGGTTTYLAGITETMPVWLRLARSGDTVSGYVSSDGVTWTLVGSTVPDWVGMNAADGWVTAGFVVCSHDPSTLNTSTFDNVAIIDGAPWGTLPGPWGDGSADIGSTGVAGSASWAAGTFTVNGAGADIWGTSDSFHFVRQSFFCDCPGVPVEEYAQRHVQMTARVTSLQNTNAFAKAGIMLRSALAPQSNISEASAPMVVLDIRPTGDIEFMARGAQGGDTAYLAGASSSFPVWLRLTRVEDTVTAYVSSDGTQWDVVGSTTTGVSSDNIEVGMAVTSHDPTTLNTSTFDNVELLIPR